MPEPRAVAYGPSVGVGAQPRPMPPPKAGSGQNFANTLDEARVRFSAHAEKRLAARDITIQPPDMQRLAEAVSRAEQKGSRDSLILMDDLAFIVDVRQRTIVTAMDSRSQREGVFTNVDTVVFAK